MFVRVGTHHGHCPCIGLTTQSGCKGWYTIMVIVLVLGLPSKIVCKDGTQHEHCPCTGANFKDCL